MPKPYSVTVIVSQEYRIQIDAVDEAEAEVLACNAVENGEGEFVETKEAEAVSITEYIPE